MHRHWDCGENGRERGRFAMRGGPRGFSFGPGGFHFEFGDGGDDGWNAGRSRGRRNLMFKRELRLVLLKLISDKPRHGYELIREIEEMTGGVYTPSPGVVYPTLTMLQDMGHIAEAPSDDSKKVYEATEEGRAHLAENKADVEALFERLEEHGSRRQRATGGPPIGRAVGNLMNALRHRVSRNGINEELLHEIAAILDDAAQRIERLKDSKPGDSDDD